ncbi:XRE family transcriptional regulator [Jiangella aurantiaca]|uniref:XRE family transcriptional regulator n=1 Tax=Jiangella aurantiaca TaxID=2530373 RepID=A0A4R5AE44_9ACTN|nr:helix-turn-helix transcriptional regulator [Jiangella aurantiaca]TDD70788.1 XRE family transcriptional regulator [Jiangella aurantiaca]
MIVRTAGVTSPEQTVGSVIRQARCRLGYSQYGIADELARISGNGSLTRDEVARWERGKRIPGPYWRQWISQVLDVGSTDLERAARAARQARRARVPQ